jgi:Fic-DOC domain mobile mystery protein B
MSTIPNLNSTPGNTPLHPDDAAQLIPSLATKGESDEWEQLNILEAQNWAFSTRVMATRNPVDEIYLRELHRRMFDKTWKWAGKYRTRDLSIGCPFFDISQRIGVLLGDVQYWLVHETFGIDEISLRFHHKLVWWIHAFPNGNGRHARLLSSVLAVKHGRTRFSWGRANLVRVGSARQAYLDALHALDANEDDLQPLLTFARS